MDTLVTTREDVDLGHGPTRQIMFPDAQSVVDKQSGCLHVHGTAGTIGSFNEPVWAVAVRGEVRQVNGVATVSLA